MAFADRRERGAAAVELALVLPLFLLMIFGIVEFGRVYHVQATIDGAAREGVRVMALQQDATAARAAAVDAASPTVAITAAQVSTTACTSSTLGDTVTVRVTHPLQLFTGAFGAQLTLTGTGTMRCGG